PPAPAADGRGWAAARSCRYRSSVDPARRVFRFCLRSCRAPRPRLCGAFHGVDDRLVTGAAAVVAGEMRANLLAVRRLVLPQQVLRRHQHAGRAEATLQRIAITEGGL